MSNWFNILVGVLLVGLIVVVILLCVGVLPVKDAAGAVVGSTDVPEYGSFVIQSPQTLPYDHTKTFDKAVSVAPVVNVSGRDTATNGPALLGVKDVSKKDFTVRVQDLPPLGLPAQNGMVVSTVTAEVPLNSKVDIMDFGDGSYALGLHATVGTSASNAAYLVSNGTGSFKKRVHFFTSAALSNPISFAVAPDNVPMAVTLESTSNFQFRKCYDTDGITFTGGSAQSLAAQTLPKTTSNASLTLCDMKLLNVNGHPTFVWYEQTADSVGNYNLLRASDANGSAWGNVVTAIAVAAANASNISTRVNATIVEDRLIVAGCSGSNVIHYNIASDSNATAFGTKTILTQTNAIDAADNSVRLVSGAKNASGTTIPVLCYIGATSKDVVILPSTTSAGAWGSAVEVVLANSTVLDDSEVYLEALGAIVDPDGNLCVMAISQSQTHFLYWKCNGVTPPSEPKVLDIGVYNDASMKAAPFGFEVVDGRPLMAWNDTSGPTGSTLKYVHFADFECDQNVTVEYFTYFK